MVKFELVPQIRLHEVNMVPTIYLGRYPIYYWAGAVIAAAGIVIFLRAIFLEAKGNHAAFLNRIAGGWKYLFFISLICVGLIDIPLLVFQKSRCLYYVKSFFGKPLEQSRALITGFEICEFADFCRKNIPEAQPVKLYAPDELTRFDQLAYYLYPLDARSNTPLADVNYAILFYPQADLSKEQLADFRLFAVRKQGQLILKRITSR